ncbi:uncharacterized protein GGS25DRAFT_502761 [Hypoxylon fragiforme]|uniref:uncharacterized protein n=1 Tax=Hypoxylon fragiforme TaxID=63214 RepID=UPI0020C69789|nr:uncharacterized protein GGS25DRAFT_502761 [Hypoxylon fragiforme]KAI2604958.1 hypothetical protein GGS25DRAFT_502761 [Hypoxylon fragiforme]
MSYMSRNNSSASLMGFSILQPAVGGTLQFFPAMGSKQLDELINAYVPGNASISEKRATVSMEFFQHAMLTGESFKFFTVYPSRSSTIESPAGSTIDSGYVSNFTSPVISESQWTPSSSGSAASPTSNVQKTSSKKLIPSTDFSHLPGMKILTKDGMDVTNSASRGCKTKEQRDHAHLMRVIKACDACRRKKVRCDPSHKRSSGSSGARVTKKVKKSVAVSAPSAPAPAPSPAPTSSASVFASSFDTHAASLSFNSVMSESLVDPNMDWNQFIQFDEQPTEAIPYDYDFFLDPAGYLSPTSSNSFSASQPITPAQSYGTENRPLAINEGETQLPLPPYYNPGGEAGNDYADFNLYSPGSSTSLDDDPALIREVAAMPHPEYSDYLSRQQPLDGNSRQKGIMYQDHNFTTQSGTSAGAESPTSLFWHEQTSSPERLYAHRNYFSSISPSIQPPITTHGDNGQTSQIPEWHVPTSTGDPHLIPHVRANGMLSIPGGTDVSPTQPGASPRLQGLRSRSLAPSGGINIDSSVVTNRQTQKSLTTMLATSHDPSISPFTTSPSTTTLATTSRSNNSLSHISGLSATNSTPAETPHSPLIIHGGKPTSRPAALEGYIAGSLSPVPSSSNVMLFMKSTVITVFDDQNTADRSSLIMSTVSRTFQSIAAFSFQARMVTRNIFCGLETLFTSSFENQVLRSTMILSALVSVLHGALPLSPFKPVHQKNTTLGNSWIGTALHPKTQRRSEPQEWNWLREATVVAWLLAMTTFAAVILSSLCQWQQLDNKSRELGFIPALMGCLIITVAHTNSRQKGGPGVAMLDLATRHPFAVKRLPSMAMSHMKTTHNRLSRGLSELQSYLRKSISFRPSDKSMTKGLLSRLPAMMTITS